MNRRTFLAGVITTAAGLILPYEPKRIYSFPCQPKAIIRGCETVDFGREVLVHVDLYASRGIESITFQMTSMHFHASSDEELQYHATSFMNIHLAAQDFSQALERRS